MARWLLGLLLVGLLCIPADAQVPMAIGVETIPQAGSTYWEAYLLEASSDLRYYLRVASPPRPPSLVGVGSIRAGEDLFAELRVYGGGPSYGLAGGLGAVLPLSDEEPPWQLRLTLLYQFMVYSAGQATVYAAYPGDLGIRVEDPAFGVCFLPVGTQVNLLGRMAFASTEATLEVPMGELTHLAFTAGWRFGSMPRMQAVAKAWCGGEWWEIEIPGEGYVGAPRWFGPYLRVGLSFRLLDD